MERFMQKVLKVDSGCWEWQAGSRGNGYGAFKLNGKIQDAHRVSYQLFKGPIPERKLVCHTCDNRKCVNPEHLYAGTHKDNFQDMVKRNRLNTNRDHLRKHPSVKAYEKRGCRCEDCVALIKAKRIKYHRSTWPPHIANRFANPAA